MRMFVLLLGLPPIFFLMIGAGCGILHRHQGEWRPDQLSQNCFYAGFCEVASTSGFYSIRSAAINPDQFSGFSLNLKTSNTLADFAGLGWCPVWLHDRTLFAEVPLAANEVEMRVVFCKHCFVWCCCKSFLTWFLSCAHRIQLCQPFQQPALGEAWPQVAWNYHCVLTLRWDKVLAGFGLTISFGSSLF